MAPNEKSKPRGKVYENGLPKIFNGKITDEKVSFCFIRCVELNDSIFGHISEFKSANVNIKDGDPLRFELAFSMSGPCAVNTELVQGR